MNFCSKACFPFGVERVSSFRFVGIEAFSVDSSSSRVGEHDRRQTLLTCHTKNFVNLPATLTRFANGATFQKFLDVNSEGRVTKDSSARG